MLTCDLFAVANLLVETAVAFNIFDRPVFVPLRVGLDKNIIVEMGKEPKILGSLCSVLHRWNWKDVSVVFICYGLTVIVSTR